MPNWKKVIVSGSDAHLNTLELTNTTTNDSILITSTEAGSSAAPVITLKRNSGSPADADYLGQFKFKGENNADQEVIYAKISGKIQDKADGTEDGIIEFSNIRSGSQVITARLKSDRLQLLNSTSLEVNGNIDIPDDAILNIGDADDLQLYHDGSNSYIKDNGTGTIFYRSGTQTFQNAAGSKTMAVFNAANSVDLNYNNNTKFQTTNTGVSITGNVVSSGNVSGSLTGSYGNLHVGQGVGGNLHANFGSSIAVFRTDSTHGIAIDPANNTIKGVSDGGGYALKLDGNIVYLKHSGTDYVEVGTTHSQIPGSNSVRFNKPVHIDATNAFTSGESALLIANSGAMNSAAISWGSDNTKIYRHSNGMRIESAGGIKLYGSADTLSMTVNSAGINVVGGVTASGDFGANGNIVGDGSTNITGILTGSLGRVEATTISASRLDVDAGTLAIGGTTINKSVADNIQNTSGTNTGDITLAGGSKDFVQLTNQVVTVNQVDLTDDVTGVLPSANLDSDTAHLTTTQTFSGIKTFSAPITASAGVSGSASSTGSFGKMVVGSDALANSGSTLFEIKGQQGTLFNVTDEMSGSIFSANTISGIPVIEAFSDQTVRLGPIANQVEVGLGGHITSSANISSSATLIGANISSSGDIVADGDVVAYNSSDMRLKNNLKVIEGALDKIDGIAGYEFDWNDNSPGWARERGHDVGVVAQEIEKIHPEIVEERKNGYLGVDYKRLVPLLIQSIKELKQEVEELKKKV